MTAKVYDVGQAYQGYTTGHSISAMPAPLTLASLNVDCEVLTSELSAREVGRALSLSHGAVSKYRCAVRAAGGELGRSATPGRCRTGTTDLAGAG
jgi:hypothetical protein